MKVDQEGRPEYLRGERGRPLERGRECEHRKREENSVECQNCIYNRVTNIDWEERDLASECIREVFERKAPEELVEGARRLVEMEGRGR